MGSTRELAAIPAIVHGATYADPNVHYVGTTSQSYHQYGDITVNGNGFTIIGDAYLNGTSPETQVKANECIKFGLCLGSAPQLESSLFVGREAELDKMSQVLGSEQVKQLRLILGGIGGIGKTQLAIAYAERFQEKYDSVFWLNATSKRTLQADLRLVAARVLQASALERLQDHQILARVHEWLSDTKNTRWLLIFDNYDEPSQFEIGEFCPYTAHGAVVVTTRLPDCVSLGSEKIYIQSLNNVEEGLDILCRRSGRTNLQHDKDARNLVERLAGLPLALATAGAYLSKCPSMSCRDYLSAYTERWNIDPQRPLELQEYRDRTLYSTWDISYARLQTDDPQAGQLLKLLAYFDNQKIWFELLACGTFHPSSSTMRRVLRRISKVQKSLRLVRQVLSDRVHFEGAMRTLIRYCFVEAQSTTKSYSMHNCVHDWTLATLNKDLDKRFYWYAYECVANAQSPIEFTALGEMESVPLAAHATRLAHSRLLSGDVFDDMPDYGPSSIYFITTLLVHQHQYSAAEEMRTKLLLNLQQRKGPNHVETVTAMCRLGAIYRNQKRFDEAEQIVAQALARMETSLKPDDEHILSALSDLAWLYFEQDKLDQAEETHKRLLAARERELGPDDLATRETACRIGRIYSWQGRFDKAEEMLERALSGARGEGDMFNFWKYHATSALAEVYYSQNKHEKAKPLFEQLYTAYEQAVAANKEVDTMLLCHQLGVVFEARGRLQDAERMYRKAIQILEKRVVPQHVELQEVKGRLERLQARQGRAKKGTQILQETCSSE